MKGVTVKQVDERNVLTLTDQPEPEMGPDDLLIKVQHAAVNRTDILNKKGKTNYAVNPILGVEAAGTVIDANGHSAFTYGDRVMGLVNGGGYAEYAVMPAERAMRIPESLSSAEGAAIPEVFLTAYQTLFWIAGLESRETVLIHAGASGVGTAAIQLARQLCDAQIIVTAGSEEKLQFCWKLGADVLVNYKEQSFSEAVQEATNSQGADVILDFIGARYWDMNLASIRKGGRWVLIGVLGGSELSNINLMPLMSKYVQLTGTLLTPRSDAYKADLSKEFSQVAVPEIEKGTIYPIVDRIFPVAEANDAHEYMEANHNIGKIILEMDS